MWQTMMEIRHGSIANASCDDELPKEAMHFSPPKAESFKFQKSYRGRAIHQVAARREQKSVLTGRHELSFQELRKKLLTALTISKRIWRLRNLQ